MKFTRRIFLLLVLAGVYAPLMAQPCLEGWNYRVPVAIDNSANTGALMDYQVEIVVNTQLLIAGGKVQMDGDDFRFLSESGAVLPHWIENETYNTSSTSFWVKVDAIAASANTNIYMFYGNASAPDITSGDNTFELFDDFDDITVNPDKWDVCGAATVNVASGTITLSSTATAGQKSILKADNAINAPVIIESDVVSISNGHSFSGLQNTSDNGFVMTYEVNGQPSMLMREIVSDGGGCFKLDDVQDPLNQTALSANITTGTWAFSWYPTERQSFSWPGQSTTEIRNEDGFQNDGTPIAATDPASVHPVFGHINQGDLDGVGTTATGSVEIDWIIVRKHTDNPPVVGNGVEEVILNEVATDGPETICTGEDLNLTAEALSGAVFSWSGPNGFTSADQNPTVSAVTVSATGWYVVTATVPANCFSQKDSTHVTVNPVTVAGTLSGDATVCFGDNSGTLSLSGNTGDVVRWESSETVDGPWMTIAETNTSLDYENLLTTTYFRAIVQSGNCTREISNTVEIQVDEPTVPGKVIGQTEVCYQVNAGQLLLTDYQGTILNWERRPTSTTAWATVNNDADTLNYSGLTTSTWYRAIVQSGVCAAMPSDSVLITVKPLPTVAFETDTVCLGSETSFTNLSSVSTGSLASFQWNFDDGSGSSLRNPKHAFTSAGNYDVQLIVTTSSGCVDSLTQRVVVAPLPEVAFLTDNVCLRYTSSFEPNVSLATGTISSYEWSFGDGETIVNATPDIVEHAYATDGNYTVSLTATSARSCETRFEKEITIYPRTTVSFDADSVYLGQTTRFNNYSYTTAGNLSYQWSFGDGVTSTHPNPEHLYTYADTFNVQLITRSSFGGCQDTLVQEYIVHDQVSADFEVANVCMDDAAQFINHSTIGYGNLTYAWDFGDGTTSSEENPIHTFEVAGIYLIHLTATADEGSVDEIEKWLTIYPEPQAAFSTEPVCDAIAMEFENGSRLQQGTMTHFWDFGDGSSSTESAPEHLYMTHGDYDVLLVNTTQYGCRDSITHTVTVHPAPVPLFSVDTVCHEVESMFVNESSIASGSVDSYLWKLGDGTNSVEVNPVKLYADPGLYTVSLTATSDLGCVRTYTDNAKVLVNPTAAFKVEDVCFEDASEFINESVAGEGQLSYAWTLGDGATSALTDVTHAYSYFGEYEVKMIATTSFGCVDSTYTVTKVSPLPGVVMGEDQSTSKGYPVELSASGGIDYAWTPAESLDNEFIANPIATPLSTTTYEVFVVDENGCEGSGETTVNVEDDFVLVPSNVMTPDGNLINDAWYIENIEAYPEAEVSVFNLWGQRVYKTSGYQNDWEGIYNSDLLQNGEYIYTIASPNHSKVYRGTLTILRK